MELENKSICFNCGGKCCKKSGCDYYPRDFETINKEYITSVLDTGNVSIVSILMFSELKNGKLVCNPFLYLRARNVDRGVVDLLSLKKQCSMLRDDGCAYSLEERPSGGVNLIPVPDFKCYFNGDMKKEILAWEPYQKLLQKLVKRYSGMSVEQRFLQDVEQVFIDMFDKNVEGVAQEEIIDMLSTIKILSRCYPEIATMAMEKCKNKELKRGIKYGK